jgi:hypothetical protein
MAMGQLKGLDDLPVGVQDQAIFPWKHDPSSNSKHGIKLRINTRAFGERQ